MNEDGLSPRVWGNHADRIKDGTKTGSIPTCVGQPDDIRERNAPQKVYPHVCGATKRRKKRSKIRLGLSPRVWGNLLVLL